MTLHYNAPKAEGVSLLKSPDADAAWKIIPNIMWKIQSQILDWIVIHILKCALETSLSRYSLFIPYHIQD